MALIACGRLGRPHGVHGEVRVWPLNPATTLLEPGRTLRVGHEPTAARTMVVEACRKDAKGYFVRFVGLSDRDAAGALTGMTWFEPREAFPEPADDEIYIADLIGLPVRTEAGQAVGTVVDVWQAGGTDLLVIRGPGGEHLVPNVEAFVTRLDPAAGEVVIRPIEGLIDGLGEGPGA